MQDETLNRSLQIEQNKTNERNKMKMYLQKLHVHLKIWRNHNKNAIC
jgi:hypothetical protein